MAKAIIELSEHSSRVLTILKGKFGLKNKSDVINFLIKEYENLLPVELRPVDLTEYKKNPTKK